MLSTQSKPQKASSCPMLPASQHINADQGVYILRQMHDFRCITLSTDLLQYPCMRLPIQPSWSTLHSSNV